MRTYMTNHYLNTFREINQQFGYIFKAWAFTMLGTFGILLILGMIYKAMS